MPRELFVYWKLDDREADTAISASRAMQAELQAQHPGLACRLHRRSDVRAGQATLMESYRHRHPQGVDTALATAIADAATRHLQAWAAAPRHAEWFDALSD